MLREAWDRHAEEWIRWARAPGHDSYWRFHRDAFLSLLPPPGQRTIDVGCGEGRLDRELGRLGHHVVGMDGSPVMAAAAAGHPEGGGPVMVGDAAALPLPDAAADCLIAFMSLQDVDDFEAAVFEAARVLRVGGHLVMAITHPLNTAGTFVPTSPGAESYRFVLEGSWFTRRALAETCEQGGFTMTFHSEHRPLQDYTEAMAAAGFVIERLREMTEPDPADKWHEVPMFLDMRARRV